MKEKLQTIIIFYVPLSLGAIAAVFIYFLLYKLIMVYSLSGFFIFTAGFCVIGLFYNFLAYYHGKTHKDAYLISKSLNRMYEHGVICVIALLLMKLFNVFL